MEIFHVLDQTEYNSIPASMQIFLFGVVWNDLFQGKSRQDIRQSIRNLIMQYGEKPDVKRQIDTIVESSESIKALSVLVRNFAPKYLGVK